MHASSLNNTVLLNTAYHEVREGHKLRAFQDLRRYSSTSLTERMSWPKEIP